MLKHLVEWWTPKSLWEYDTENHTEKQRGFSSGWTLQCYFQCHILIVTLCWTLRIDVMSLSVGCVHQMRNHKTYVQYGIAAKHAEHLAHTFEGTFRCYIYSQSRTEIMSLSGCYLCLHAICTPEFHSHKRTCNKILVSTSVLLDLFMCYII